MVSIKPVSCDTYYQVLLHCPAKPSIDRGLASPISSGKHLTGYMDRSEPPQCDTRARRRDILGKAPPIALQNDAREFFVIRHTQSAAGVSAHRCCSGYTPRGICLDVRCR